MIFISLEIRSVLHPLLSAVQTLSYFNIQVTNRLPNITDGLPVKIYLDVVAID